MLLDQVTDTQMRAGSLVMGATMVAFLGAQWFPRYTRPIRLVVTGVYVFGLIGAVLYFLLLT